MATYDLLANDSRGEYPLDPASLVFSSVDASLTIVDNGDGTVDVEGDELGTKYFSYTVDDTNATTSNTALVTVTVVANPQTPSEVGTLIQHLDATTLGLADAAAVTSWPAEVGNNGVLINPAPSTTVKYYEALAAMNSKPAVYFDFNATGFKMGSMGTDLESYTIMAVVSYADIAATAAFGNDDATAGTIRYTMNTDTTNTIEWTSGVTQTTNAAIYDIPVILALRMSPNGATSDYWTWCDSDSDSDIGAATNALPNVEMALGAANASGSNQWRGSIGEFAMWSNALTDIEMENVRAAWYTKWQA